jgi:8-oxo-dGTP pyrophosphatase MutT (NUDIX family)
VTEPPIRRARERLVHANDYVRVYDDDVTFAGGDDGRYVRIEPAGEGPGAVVLAVHEGRIALVRTYRYPLGAWQWALPRGFAHGSDPLVTARAELAEETGVTESRLEVLGSVTPDSGVQSHRVAVVLAWVDRPPGGGPTDGDEVAEVRWVSLAELEDEIGGGGIEDGFTLAALTLARVRGALQHD